MVLGAVGTGKTSACMYPYVDQLLRWRADDPEPKIGGLVLEVKGDFCRQVAVHAARPAATRDYVEIGLDTGVCYNPLHNDLDPYAVAYAIATLLNNLFGKSKEPFWQQAYTDLLKFVILLRRITDGYTTLAEVYRYILDDRRSTATSAAEGRPQRSRRTSSSSRQADYRDTASRRAWTHWFAEDADQLAHPYDAELETYLAAQKVPFDVRKPTGRRAGRPGSTSSRPSSAGTCTAGVGSTPGSARPSPKASSCSCRCSTTTRRCTARSARRAVPTPATRRPETRGRSRRSKHCSRAGNGPRAELPGGDEPWPGARPRRDAEARLPARRPAAHSADHGRSRNARGATCCSSATSTTPSPRWAKPTPPATSARSRCPARRG